jgi:hypothetical protein
MRLTRLMRRFFSHTCSKGSTMMARCAVCALGAALLAVGQCAAPTYYVSSTAGSDTNEGSQAKPWATLEHAVTAIDAQGMAMQRLTDCGCSIARTSDTRGTTSLSHFVAPVTCG